jgi:monoamine oxidase
MLLNPQVIIVGAGLSGLRAATQVRDHGLSYVVLEAMDRPGGKVFSMPAVNDSSGDTGVVDLGAAWLNDSGQSKIYELAVEYGIELVEQRVTGLSLEEDSEGVKSFPYGEASAVCSLLSLEKVAKLTETRTRALKHSSFTSLWSSSIRKRHTSYPSETYSTL